MCPFVFIHFFGPICIFNIFMCKGLPRATSCQVEGRGGRRAEPSSHINLMTIA
jgi:hypothetical protein